MGFLLFFEDTLLATKNGAPQENPPILGPPPKKKQTKKHKFPNGGNGFLAQSPNFSKAIASSPYDRPPGPETPNPGLGGHLGPPRLESVGTHIIFLLRSPS